jgi:hypothetical protein
MSQFALKKVEEITGKIPFYLLYIDDVCEYNEFESLIQKEGTYTKQLLTAQTRMQMISQGHLLPKEKFKDITPELSKKQQQQNCPPPIKEYEIKTDHLRIYLIEHTPSGKIIVCGGKKKSQSKDIQKFRKIKDDYLTSLTK